MFPFIDGKHDLIFRPTLLKILKTVKEVPTDLLGITTKILGACTDIHKKAQHTGGHRIWGQQRSHTQGR